MLVIFYMKIFENQSMERKKTPKKNNENVHFRHEFQVKFCYNLANNSSCHPFSSLEFLLTKDSRLTHTGLSLHVLKQLCFLKSIISLSATVLCFAQCFAHFIRAWLPPVAETLASLNHRAWHQELSFQSFYGVH